MSVDVNVEDLMNIALWCKGTEKCDKCQSSLGALCFLIAYIYTIWYKNQCLCETRCCMKMLERCGLL